MDVWIYRGLSGILREGRRGSGQPAEASTCVGGQAKDNLGRAGATLAWEELLCLGSWAENPGDGEPGPLLPAQAPGGPANNPEESGGCGRGGRSCGCPHTVPGWGSRGEAGAVAVGGPPPPRGTARPRLALLLPHWAFWRCQSSGHPRPTTIGFCTHTDVPPNVSNVRTSVGKGQTSGSLGRW